MIPSGLGAPRSSQVIRVFVNILFIIVKNYVTHIY